jgi:hypothetical protein
MGKDSRMNRSVASLLAILLLPLLVGHGVAHAGMIGWHGVGEGTGLGVSTTNFWELPSTDPRNRPGDDVPLLSGIQFHSNLTGGDTRSTDVVLVGLAAFNEGPDAPETISFDRAPYDVIIHITDLYYSLNGGAEFRGTLDGTISADSSALSNTFLSPMTQSLVLGGNRYTVTIGPFIPPQGWQQTDFQAGEIDAHVQVDPVAAPEPSAMALAALGLSLLGSTGGAAGFRRRRSAAT